MIRSLVSAAQGPRQKGERWPRTRGSKLSLCRPLTAHSLPGLRLTLPAIPRGAQGQAHTACKPPGVPGTRLTAHKPLRVPRARCEAGSTQQWFPK